MDKLIKDCCSCNSTQPESIVNIVSGNDFYLSVQLSKYNSSTSTWESYDMNECEDVDLYIFTQNDVRTHLITDITISGKVEAKVESTDVECRTYGIGILWKENGVDKNVRQSNMFNVYDSGSNSIPTVNTYDFNVQIEDGVAYISMGQIPDMDMSDYVTNSQLTSSLDQLWQDCNDEFIDHEELADAISDIDLSNYVTQTSLNTTLQDYVQTSDLSDYVTESSLNTTLSDYVTQTSLNTTLQDYVQTSALDDYVTDTELQDAISGVIIDETNLVHKTDNESIAGTKTFTNRVLVQQGMSISGDLLVNSSQSLLSCNVLESAPVSIQTGRISTNQLATSDIIAPSSDYTSSTSGFSGTKDTIVFSRDVASSPSIVTLQQIAKIDSNGIYEGTTLLEDKYLQIADLPSIPTTTSDLTNDSGFITNSDLTTTLSPIESDITSLDGRVTTLEQSGSGVSQEDWDNANEAIAQELTDNRLAHLDINNQFSNYYTKTDSDSRYATQSWANNKFVTQSDDVNRQQAIAAAFSQSQDDLDSLDSRVTTLEQSGGGGGGSVPSNVVVSDDGNEIVCLTQSEYDTLEQNQQLESDVFYYITDATSNYVSQSDLTTAIAGVTIDETNLVHKSGTETITGSKTFNSLSTVFDGQCTFNYSSHSINYIDNLYGIGKTSMFGRGSFNQACIGQILAPNQNITNNTTKFDNQVNTILFQTVNGANSDINPTGLTTIAKIDSNGIYEGTTLLSNKYAQISSVPTATSDLNNDSGFVSSSSVTNIWQGSQSDYNNISTPDQNTLYIII